MEVGTIGFTGKAAAGFLVHGLINAPTYLALQPPLGGGML